MYTKIYWLSLPVLLGGAVLPQPAAAQALDQLGNRASALGAFVAVADDAAAVAWNPAGLVNGPIFNIMLDLSGRTTEPGNQSQMATHPAGRAGGTFLAAGVMPLGFSYYRMRQTELNPAVTALSGRQNREVAVRSLVTSHLGVTVLQSLADGVTIGATVKLVRGSLAAEVIDAGSWSSAFEAAEAFDGHAQTKVDVDAGVLYAPGRLRVGVVVRNLAAPTFVAGARAASCPEPCRGVRLDRHVRAGVAWGDTWPGTANRIVAIDADVTRVQHPGGDRRDVAAGAEQWFGAQKFAVRGGVRASTVGGVRPLASGGGSVAVRSGMYVDVYAARGREDRRWGVAARLMY